MTKYLDILERAAYTAFSAFTAVAFIGNGIDWKAGGIAALAAGIDAVKGFLALSVPGTVSPASMVKDRYNG